MVVNKVVAPKPAKMVLVQRDDMVEQFATCTAHPALRHSVGEGGQLHGMVTLPILLLKSSILIIH